MIKVSIFIGAYVLSYLSVSFITADLLWIRYMFTGWDNWDRANFLYWFMAVGAAAFFVNK